MAEDSPVTVVGCLLDVSGSMRSALDTGRSDEKAIDHLNAVLRAALRLAQAEQSHNPSAFVFVGVFGLNTEKGCPAVVDLCGVVDAPMNDENPDKTGHELLIERANKEGVGYVSKYIREKLSDEEARIVDAYLRRHRDRIDEFMKAIPAEEEVMSARHKGQDIATLNGGAFGLAAMALAPATGGLSIFGSAPGTAVVATGLARAAGTVAVNAAEDSAVESLQAIKIAREICQQWLQDFPDLILRPVGKVIELLQRLQARSPKRADGAESRNKNTLMETMRSYMHGWTPMKDAMTRSLEAFRGVPGAEQRVLVLMSDGASTDGDPMNVAAMLKREGVKIATIYLTSNSEAPRRRLYDQELPDKYLHDANRTNKSWAQCCSYSMGGYTYSSTDITTVGSVTLLSLSAGLVAILALRPTMSYIYIGGFSPSTCSNSINLYASKDPDQRSYSMGGYTFSSTDITTMEVQAREIRTEYYREEHNERLKELTRTIQEARTRAWRSAVQEASDAKKPDKMWNLERWARLKSFRPPEPPRLPAFKDASGRVVAAEHGEKAEALAKRFFPNPPADLADVQDQ